MDPCVADVTERPERYLDYDTETGEIIPKEGLTGNARQKALHTINDLGLNELDVRFYRIDWTRAFIADILLLPTAAQRDFIASSMEQPIEYAGVTAMVIEQLRHNGHV